MEKILSLLAALMIGTTTAAPYALPSPSAEVWVSEYSEVQVIEMNEMTQAYFNEIEAAENLVEYFGMESAEGMEIAEIMTVAIDETVAGDAVGVFGFTTVANGDEAVAAMVFNDEWYELITYVDVSDAVLILVPEALADCVKENGSGVLVILVNVIE